jgi:hypothetical protein
MNYNFNEKQRILLEKIYFVIDSKRNINNKICQEMCKFLFNDLNNLDDIKSIIKNNNLIVDKTCLDYFLVCFKRFSNQSKNVFIEFIKYFKSNMILDCNEIKYILNTYICKFYINKFSELLSIFDNYYITENILTDICCYNIDFGHSIIIFLHNEYINNSKSKFISEKIKINSNNLLQIIEMLSDFHSQLDFITKLDSIVEFTIDVNIMTQLYHEDYKECFSFFEKKCPLSSFDLEPIFIRCIQTYNLAGIKKLIENKFIPKAEHLYYLQPIEINPYCKKKDITKQLNCTEIVKFFVSLESLGILITEDIYTYLTLINIVGLDKIEFSHISKEFKNNIKNKQNAINGQTKCPYNTKATNIDQLRKMYAKDYLNKLKNVSNIIPDKICFFNALHNNNNDVMTYVFDKYKYIPSMFDIFTINNFEKRMFLLQKFYPDNFSNMLKDYKKIVN